MNVRMVLAFLFCPLLLMAQTEELSKTEDKKNLIYVQGSVADYVTHKPIPGTSVDVLSADSVLLESLTAKGIFQRGDVITQLSDFYFQQKRGYKYILRVSYKEYETEYVPIDLTKTLRHNANFLLIYNSTQTSRCTAVEVMNTVL